MKREVFLQNMMTAIAADIELELRRKKIAILGYSLGTGLMYVDIEIPKNCRGKMTNLYLILASPFVLG